MSGVWPRTNTTLVPRIIFTSEGQKGQTRHIYDGDELLKPHHVPVIVPSSKEELELAEATRNKLHVKMNDSACVEKRVNITPPNYLKENFMATFTPQITGHLSKFSDMHDAFTIAQKCIADHESENFNLRNKIQNDDHDSMIKHFSKLEVEHLNLELKYHISKKFWNTKNSDCLRDAPSFYSCFVIGKLNEQIQSRGNTIRELKEKISRLTEKNSDADPTLDLKALVSQNKDLTAKLNALHDLNERFRVENAKDQLKDNSTCVTISDSKPKVLAPGRYLIDVEPIPPRLKKNREVHLHYIKHLKENVETLREIVEEAKGPRVLRTFSPRDKQNASTSHLEKASYFVEPLKGASAASSLRSDYKTMEATGRTSPVREDSTFSLVYCFLRSDVMVADQGTYAPTTYNLACTKHPKPQLKLGDPMYPNPPFSPLSNAGSLSGLLGGSLTKDHLCSACQLGRVGKLPQTQEIKPLWEVLTTRFTWIYAVQ
ncbi:hypothetical protein Tco_0004498 [Tanacetum coccineum]